MITINYNNVDYRISKNSYFKHLLLRKDLLALPPKIWWEMLTKLYGLCLPSTLHEVLTAIITNYDKSDHINVFYINNKPYWLDKNTRISLQHLVDCSDQEVTLLIGNDLFTMSVDKAKDLLARIEVYAGKCFLTTHNHLSNIKELQELDALINYDYIYGYPEPLTFEL